MTKQKQMTQEELRASFDRAQLLSERLRRLVGYRGMMANYEQERAAVSYDVLERLLSAYESSLLDHGASIHTGVPRDPGPPDALDRFPDKGDALLEIP